MRLPLPVALFTASHSYRSRFTIRAAASLVWPSCNSVMNMDTRCRASRALATSMLYWTIDSKPSMYRRAPLLSNTGIGNLLSSFIATCLNLGDPNRGGRSFSAWANKVSFPTPRPIRLLKAPVLVWKVEYTPLSKANLMRLS